MKINNYEDLNDEEHFAMQHDCENFQTEKLTLDEQKGFPQETTNKKELLQMKYFQPIHRIKYKKYLRNSQNYGWIRRKGG